MVEIIYNKSIEKLVEIFKQNFKEEVEEIIRLKDKVIIAIPGGRSVVPFIKSLKELDINWKKTHFFMVDERLIDINDKESNYKQAKELLFDDLMKKDKIGIENIHPFIYDANTAMDDQGANAYSKELNNYGNKFDIVLLGVGEDGHIAGLYPKHNSFYNESKGFFSFHDSPKMPKDRMTSSKKMIIESDVSFTFFIGGGKKNAYLWFQDANIKEDELPVKIIERCKKSYIITDIGDRDE